MADMNGDVKKMPKGGRKGGAKFPQLTLAKALEYSKKLVSKTHTGSLPKATIYAGVFNTPGTMGDVRASALKQYGLLQGTPAAYLATQLAKDIDAAPEEERSALLQRSCLMPKVFAELFQTYKGDTVSRAKIEQRARALNVHPESAIKCASFFIESAILAGIGRQDGENVAFGSSSQPVPEFLSPDTSNPELNNDDEVEEKSEESDSLEGAPKHELAPARVLVGTVVSNHTRSRPSERTVAVNVEVDSNTDPAKLEKNLKVLRSYGLL